MEIGYLTLQPPADTQGTDTSVRADRGAAQHPAHPDFSRAVLVEMYRYPRKNRHLALALWLITGIFGGHRYYLGRTLTAALMTLTAGGGLIWWLIDLALLRRMVDAFNSEQARRQREGLPPSALSFMPPLNGATLPPVPEWVGRRGGRGRLYGDVLVLGAAGFSVGVLASASGNFEPVIAILALSAITLLGARWDALATLPILASFDRWSHRLRLYYYVNDPGGPLRLFFRPIVGLVTAPLRQRARAEAWLYLQIGLWFTILFTGIDLLESISFDETGLGLHPIDFLLDAALTLASIYAFAAPIGAILTTHVLLEKRDAVVWALTGITLATMLSGILVVA